MKMRRMALAILLTAACSPTDEDRRAARGFQADEGAAPAVVYLDVRTPAEFAAGSAPGAINIPVEVIEARMAELEPFRGDSIIVFCRTGRRAGIAMQALERAGFENTRNARTVERALREISAAGR